VQAHQGQLWVESNPGEGVEFCFSLPVSVPAAVTEGALV
jgi:signal transduction histidine kinase